MLSHATAQIIERFENARLKHRVLDMQAFTKLFESKVEPSEVELLKICGDAKGIAEAYCYLARSYLYQLRDLGAKATLADRYRCAARAEYFINLAFGYDSAFAYYANWKLYSIGKVFSGLDKFNEEKNAEYFLNQGIKQDSPYCHFVVAKRLHAQSTHRSPHQAAFHAEIAASAGLKAGMTLFGDICEELGKPEEAKQIHNAYLKTVSPWEAFQSDAKVDNSGFPLPTPSLKEHVTTFLFLLSDPKNIPIHYNLWGIFTYGKKPNAIEAELHRFAQQQPTAEVFTALTYLYFDPKLTSYNPTKGIRCFFYALAFGADEFIFPPNATNKHIDFIQTIMEGSKAELSALMKSSTNRIYVKQLFEETDNFLNPQFVNDVHIKVAKKLKPIKDELPIVIKKHVEAVLAQLPSGAAEAKHNRSLKIKESDELLSGSIDSTGEKRHSWFS